MTEAQRPSSASTPTPQQLNKITAQLRNLNQTYKAAVAANGKTRSSGSSSSKSSS